MPSYMIQVAYTAEAWDAMCDGTPCMPDISIKPVVDDLEDKFKKRKPPKEGMMIPGVHYVEGWGSFGDYDAVAIITAQDNVQASAVAIALLGRGVLKAKSRTVKAFKAVKTTPLLDPKKNETEEAINLAGMYKP